MDTPTAVLFDIDGTLIDTGGAGGRSWARAFNEVFGMPADITKFSEVGMTDPVVARQTFVGTMGRDPSGDELAALMTAYVRGLPEEVAASPDYRVLPGVVDLLQRLSSSRTMLGLVSGNLEGAAHIKIARGDLNRYFPFGGYGTDSADRIALTRAAIARAETMRGYPLDPAEVFVVGDTPLDVAAARDAGAVSVAVATGLFNQDQLRDAGAQHVLATLEVPFPPG
jgi:phosphoglycolate phosphatase